MSIHQFLLEFSPVADLANLLDSLYAHQRGAWLKEQVVMNASHEKEHLALKVNSNALNQKSGVVLLLCELLAEYRALMGRSLAHADALKNEIDTLNEKIIERDGGTVPSTSSPAARQNSG